MMRERAESDFYKNGGYIVLVCVTALLLFCYGHTTIECSYLIDTKAFNAFANFCHLLSVGGIGDALVLISVFGGYFPFFEKSYVKLKMYISYLINVL